MKLGRVPEVPRAEARGTESLASLLCRLLSAQALIVAASPKCLLADKAYDSNQIRELLSHLEAVACIPPKANRKVKSAFDKEVYKARNAVECAFNLLKQARRFATRYEKTLRNYVSVVAIGCALLWLRI